MTRLFIKLFVMTDTFRLFPRDKIPSAPRILTTQRLSARKPETDLKGLGHQMDWAWLTWEDGPWPKLASLVVYFNGKPLETPKSSKTIPATLIYALSIHTYQKYLNPSGDSVPFIKRTNWELLLMVSALYLFLIWWFCWNISFVTSDLFRSWNTPLICYSNILQDSFSNKTFQKILSHLG